MDYCTCELPIKMKREMSKGNKNWYCYTCEKEVDPKSKAVDKTVESLKIETPTRNEIILQDKINELIEVLKVSGLCTGVR